MELFIRKLAYADLTKRNYSKVLRQIRRLHWEEKEVWSLKVPRSSDVVI